MEEIKRVLLEPAASFLIEMLFRPGAPLRRNIQVSFGLEMVEVFS